ncbi:hypothetical protein CEXT_596531 [Caerostris extrusa]|uniref:Uncharacterized protein n=1 Tax=Caerostris extrusa TaxID=172846 RepID=A0AAV4W847_CAEEX|nr:hypothetical protein CEXT_596531 [Caerostris extrusa]
MGPSCEKDPVKAFHCLKLKPPLTKRMREGERDPFCLSSYTLLPAFPFANSRRMGFLTIIVSKEFCAVNVKKRAFLAFSAQHSISPSFPISLHPIVHPPHPQRDETDSCRLDLSRKLPVPLINLFLVCCLFAEALPALMRNEVYLEIEFRSGIQNISLIK